LLVGLQRRFVEGADGTDTSVVDPDVDAPMAELRRGRGQPLDLVGDANVGRHHQGVGTFATAFSGDFLQGLAVARRQDNARALPGESLSRGAADADVKLFADAMADNLMARYGSALLDIQGKPSFRYKGEAALPGNRGVKVSTELVRTGAEPTPVEYLMRNVGGQWKIFDVMIEGISYVQTFKNQFDAPLRQKSIKEVAAELRNGSMQATAGPAPRGK